MASCYAARARHSGGRTAGQTHRRRPLRSARAVSISGELRRTRELPHFQRNQMRSRFATILKVVCAVLLLASPLIAQTRSEDATQVQTARVRFQEGVRYYDSKQYAKARVAFAQAYALKPHLSILLNLAQSEVRSGYEADAANHFSKYLREVDSSSPTRKEAEKGLARAKKSAGEVLVKTADDGVQILLDGKEQGMSPLDGPLYVAPGSHTLEGKRGTATASTQFDAAAGRARRSHSACPRGSWHLSRGGRGARQGSSGGVGASRGR